MKSRIQILMAEKGFVEGRRINIRDVAKETGISAYTVTALADGTIKEIPVSVLEKLCRYFGCTPNDLLILEDGDKILDAMLSPRL